ncbi:dolichyl-phosphate-mannose-protein mannosyltransferase [Haloarcula quadrata]|uniref:Dolichyl-phosphate-mannose-protein mannosyltransferase n=2 Tax=Haloarcula quadrata TaxID=182779 RepID=A0A495R402_9EURY|nr:dolichyl-phosphate-mannose-protein mannosyltransferase [Haloarcula quadrata]
MLFAVGTQLYFFVTITLDSTRPPMAPDAGIFEHLGWYLTHGGRLYVDAWEPKLPLSYETTGVLALLSGGDMYRLHLLSVVLMSGAVCAIVALVVMLVYDITGDDIVAPLAGLSMFLLPGFAVRPAYGFKTKYLLVLCGLLAIYLYTRGYPALSGVAAAASVGYWQAGAIFPLIVVGLAVQRRDMRALERVVAGGLGFTIVMLLPVFLLWHSASEMVVQVFLVPLQTEEHASLLARFVAGVVHFKWTSLFVVLGGLGLAHTARHCFTGTDGVVGRTEWWIPVGAAWFVFLILFVDFETGGYTDLIPGLAFVAIGLGMVATVFRDRQQTQYLSAILALVLVVNVVFLGSVGVIFTPVETPGPEPMSDLETHDLPAAYDEAEPVPDVRYLYWQQAEPSTCHYRLSVMELRWLDRIDSSVDSRCLDFGTASARLRNG